MNRPLPILLTAFILGLVLSPPLSSGHSAGPAFLSVVLLGVILFSLGYSRRDRRPGKMRLFLSWLLFLGIGYLYACPFSLELNKPGELLSLADGRSVRLAGVLERMPVFLPERTELFVRVEQYFAPEQIRPIKGRLILYLKGRPRVQLSCGDRLLWMGGLHSIVNFKNPGAFDFENYMALKDIYLRGWVSDPRLLVVIGRSGPSLAGFIEDVRAQIQGFLDSRASPLTASLYKALIIGERGSIPKPIGEAFAKAGVNHLLAISGLHMGMVALAAYALILGLIKRFPYLLLRFSSFRIAALFSIPVVLFYGAISGMSPPSVRAMIMVFVFLMATFLRRQWDIYNNLAIAIWVILIFSPRTLYAASFQLSVMAVLAIIFLYPRWQNWTGNSKVDALARLRTPPSPVFNRLRQVFGISAIAILGTAPIVAYYFYRLSLVGLVTNAIVVPLVGTLALPLGLVSVGLMPFSLTLADAFLQLGSLVLTAVVKVTDFFAAWPMASVWVFRPRLWEILLFYIGIWLLALAYRRRAFRWCGLVCLSLIFAGELAGGYIRGHSRELQITFLDVGQGNAALVQFPGGKNMIIDGGGTYAGQFDIGERVVAPFLRTKGIRTIDYLVLTHPHPDHLGGMVFLLENFKVREVWTNGDSVEADIFGQWQGLISRSSITHREFKRGGRHTFNINGVVVDIYGPAGDTGPGGVQDVLLNRRSLVLRLGYGRRHFLLPGDIDAYRESELLREGRILKSDVLLSPHHGSKTSSTVPFIKAVDPEAVVFSVGRFNRFFFPHQDVVKRYRKAGCSIYQTDREGAVTCLTDGCFLRIEGFSPGKYLPLLKL